MKRKIVSKLLAGCLIVTLTTPAQTFAVTSEEQNQQLETMENGEEPEDDKESEEGEEPEEEKEQKEGKTLKEGETQAEDTSNTDDQKKDQSSGDQNDTQKETKMVEQVAKATWIPSGSRWWYRHADGSYTKSDWEKIDGKWYYFDASGWMMTGWQKISGKWYYFYGSGEMAADTYIGSYYVDENGVWIEQKNKTAAGWVKSGSRWWYRHADGSYTKSGWEKINGKWYYFDASGWMVTGWQKSGGSWYYLSGSGAMVTGWQKVGGSWYYLSGSGAMVTDWQKINGKWYYFYSSGAMAANTYIGSYYVDGSGAWVEEKNKVTAGWIQSGSRWWYRHADGSYTKSGWEMINGKWYYFDASGWMVTGWQKVKGSWYYLSNSGAMLTGWQRLDGERYYLSDSGAMLTGWQQIDGKWYYLKSNGAMATNTWIDNYYVDADGVWVEKEAAKGGWTKAGDRWYYDNGDGTRAKSTWKTIDGKEYYFDEDGWMVTGWLKIGTSWYYLKSNGEKAYDYWVGTTGVGGYYISKYGKMVTGTTYSYGDYIYTFDSNGLCTGKEDRYVKVVDPKNGKTYTVEKQFTTDPQVGKDVTEDEFLAAAVYTEAGNQGMPGMTGVAMVMLNRMYSGSYPESANVMIYQKQQFEVARNGSLTKCLNNIKSSTYDKAKEAVTIARSIMDAYQTSGTPRTVEGLNMPEGKTDFDYMGFMTPAAFDKAGLDPEKTYAFTHLNTTFYTTWIKK